MSEGFNTASGMRSHVTSKTSSSRSLPCRFNTASGMRSHVTSVKPCALTASAVAFQYRKRYEVTCDVYVFTEEDFEVGGFQYRKRYEVTCDKAAACENPRFPAFQYRKRYEVTCDVCDVTIVEVAPPRFNTASGMRSHVTSRRRGATPSRSAFQYRKRYEVTCDVNLSKNICICCDVSIPQAV